MTIRTDDAKNDPGEKLDMLLSHLDAMAKRMDAQDAKADADRARMDSFEDRFKKDAAKKDENGDGRAPGEPKEVAADAMDEELIEAQSRADAAYQAWGMQAAKPLAGESLRAYRIRMLRGLQQHSKNYGSANLEGIVKADAKIFDVIEGAIYADSDAAAASPLGPASGALIERVKIDPLTGRRSMTFHGRESFLKQMSIAPKYVTRINYDNTQGRNFY